MEKKNFYFFFFSMEIFFVTEYFELKSLRIFIFYLIKVFFFFSKINTISYLYFYLNRIGGASANSLSRVCLFSYLNFSFKNYFMSKFLFQQKFGH